MRLEALLILALILVGGLIYFKDGSFSSVGALFTSSESASSTDTMATSSDSYLGKVSDWFSGLWSDDTTDADEEKETTKTTTRTSGSVSAPELETPEVQQKAEEKHQELDALPEEERVDELHSPASPYAGSVTLKIGKAKDKDADKEYLLLTATKEVAISGWKLESYVTDSRATIPKGAPLLDHRTERVSDPIVLNAGDTAYLTTGETPLNSSFKENICTGYLNDYEPFSPTLKKSCPLASDDLLLFGNIANDDDECYDYVADLRQCEVVTTDDLRKEDLSSRCESFIKSAFTYDECVDRHADDTDFDSLGVWRIYLDKSGELWLSSREIIRLLDDDGRVVDVLEY